MFIDQLTGVFYKLLIHEHLPARMRRKNRPKWEKKCGLRGRYGPIPSLTGFRALVSYLPVCAKGGNFRQVGQEKMAMNCADFCSPG
jgi:hypothetical protein